MPNLICGRPVVGGNYNSTRHSEGLKLIKDTAATFGNVVDEIERANTGVEHIAEMVRKNVAVI